MNHVIPLRPFKTVLDNVLLYHDGLPCVLPFLVYLDLGHLPDTQGYLGLLSEPCIPTQTFWVGWVAHKILVSNPGPFGFWALGFWALEGLWGFGPGLNKNMESGIVLWTKIFSHFLGIATPLPVFLQIIFALASMADSAREDTVEVE